MANEREADGGRFTATARSADPDRFLCVLPAPSVQREPLCALILFNDALVRAVELPPARSGAGPIATLIRLQWWREVIEGARPDGQGEPVAAALQAMLHRQAARDVDRGAALRDALLRMIAAREMETDAPLPPEHWRDTLLGGAGGLQQAIGAVLGVDRDQADRLAAAGAAYACGALRRFLPALSASERAVLPEGLNDGDLAAGRAFLAVEGERFLRQAEGTALPRGQGTALLPTVLARRDLRGDAARFDRVGGARGIGDRLAVLAAGLRA